MNLHLIRNGQSLGPYSEEQVRQQISIGAISPDDLACPVGGQQWVPLRQVLPPGPNQPPPLPPLPTAYQAAARPPGVSPSARSGLRWMWLTLTALVVFPALAIAVVYHLLPGTLTGDVSREMEGPSGHYTYRPVGATVALYKHDNGSSSVQIVRSKLREMKTYIEANQGHVDEVRLRAMEAELPSPVRSTTTTSTGNFITEIDRSGVYDLVVWDHATVNGTTMTNTWFRVTGLKLWEQSKQEELDYDHTTRLDD